MMLVLTRKKDESILIGNDIEIVVLDITPAQIRLGIKAPKSLNIYRKEIYEAIRQENREAAASIIEINKLESEIKELFK